MTVARNKIINNQTDIYHCISRCVRRAYLYGYDSVTGKNYDHRKLWIRERLQLLVKIFSIEVLQYAIMDNHTHTMLRIRSDELDKLSDWEVLQKWLLLYPKKFVTEEPESEKAQYYIQLQLQDKNRMAELRSRLVSISWFMKSLNEYIARRANKEDDCKGRFWEGRFKSTQLVSESAILSCAIYIDLNPLKAGKANSPKKSIYTSAWERIASMKKSNIENTSLWITPIETTNDRKGFLPITFQKYLTILDASTKLFEDKGKSKLPQRVETILEEAGIVSDRWHEILKDFGHNYTYLAGNELSLKAALGQHHKKWVKGMRFARISFL